MRLRIVALVVSVAACAPALPPGYVSGDALLSVPADIAPGTWRSAGLDPRGGRCIWQRISGYLGDTPDIADQGAAGLDEPLFITVRPDDVALNVRGCLPLRRVG